MKSARDTSAVPVDFILPLSEVLLVFLKQDGVQKKRGSELTAHFLLKPIDSRSCQRKANYTQPVGLGRPAILQAPLPGPEGKSS